MSKAVYRPHHFDRPDGHIFLDKEGACMIHISGAASMSQEELNYYGEIMAEAIKISKPYKELTR